MERRQVPVLPLGRGDEAQQAEQLQAAGAEPGPRPRLHPAAVRCVDIEVRILNSPRAVILSNASQPPSYTQLFRAEEGGEGVAAGGAGSVSSLGSPPPYTSGGSQSLYTPAHKCLCFLVDSGVNRVGL